MRVGRWKFLELLEFLIENDIFKRGSILVYIWNPETHKYEKYHHCGIGTFTGIGYQYIISEAIVDSFKIDYQIDEITFYVS